MKRLSTWILASVALALVASPALAERQPGGKTKVVTREASTPAGSARVEPKAVAEDYSVQVNIVTRVQGTAFFRTAIDITNNTDADGVIAQVQYCYTISSAFARVHRHDRHPASCPSTTFTPTTSSTTWAGSASSRPSAQASSFGTLLVTFRNLPSNFGWEGTATARTYSAYQNNPATGTLAIAYPGSLFFESANTTLVGTIRDTAAHADGRGRAAHEPGHHEHGPEPRRPRQRRSFRSTTSRRARPTNGQRVGNFINVNDLQPGEVRQTNNIWAAAAIPSDVQSVHRVRRHHEPDLGFPDDRGLRQHSLRRHAGRRVLRDEVRGHRLLRKLSPEPTSRPASS